MSWHTEDGLPRHCQEYPGVGPFNKQVLNTSTGNTGNVMHTEDGLPGHCQELRPFSKQEPNTAGLSRYM
jgi:hypothetical protein